MGENNLKIRIKHRYDTEANWNKNNPVLLSGEVAISSDKSGKHKVGDGTHKWSELSYAKAELTKGDVQALLVIHLQQKIHGGGFKIILSLQLRINHCLQHKVNG